jgi:hypothetical protein
MGFWTLLIDGIKRNTAFRGLDLFPSTVEGWETPTLLGPLEITDPNQWTKGQSPEVSSM